jgi:MYXO-CTERM domain-containing protein
MFGCTYTWHSGLLGQGHRVTAQTPEPTAGFLAALGLLTALAVRRRRRR